MKGSVQLVSNPVRAGLRAHTQILDPDQPTEKARIDCDQAVYLALWQVRESDLMRRASRARQTPPVAGDADLRGPAPAAVTNRTPRSSREAPGSERNHYTLYVKEPRPTEVEAGSDERRRSRQMWKANTGKQPSRVGDDARRVRMAPYWPASPWRRARVSQTISPPGT
jgi:hypothetical protein